MRSVIGIASLALAACGSAPPVAAPAAPAAPASEAPVDAPAAPRPAVAGLGPVLAFSVGDASACAVDLEHRATCWGDGSLLRLGSGREESSTQPAAVLGVAPARAVAAGGGVACAIDEDGAVYCWGGYHQVPGDEDGIHWPVERGPTLVAAPVAGVRQISAGWVEVALLDGAGAVSILDAYVGPVPLPDFAPAVEIAALSDGFCARTTSGGVQCVTSSESGTSGNGGGPGGSGEEPGTVLAPQTWTPELERLLTDEEGNPRLAPCYVGAPDDGDADPTPDGPAAPDARPDLCKAPLTGARDLDAHGEVACVVTADGRVACWGCADCWESKPAPIGIPPKGYALVPMLVAGVHDAVAVAVGARHVCALTRGGAVLCWGSNDEGQLGDPALPGSATPVAVTGLGDVVAIDAGDATTCAQRRDRTLVCWGRTLGTPPEPLGADVVDAAEAEAAEVVHTAPEPVVPAGAALNDAAHPCRDVDVMRRGGGLDEVTYRYDRRGRLALETHREARDDGAWNHSVTRTYDRAGRIATQKAQGSEDDTRYHFRYDAQGRVIERRGDGERERWTWTRQTTASGVVEIGTSDRRKSVRLTYDDHGRVVARRESDGEREEARDALTTYDADGRVVRELTADYPFAFFDFPWQRVERRFSYDADGRRVRSEELVEVDDDQWVPQRTTVHLYDGCKPR
ncbi:MAG: hypothetical protein U1F43_31925 [Myxococcota bacterium]